VKIYFYSFILFVFSQQAFSQQSAKLMGAHSNGNSQVFSSMSLSGGGYTQISVLNTPFNSVNVETTFDDSHYRYFVKKSTAVYVIDALTGSILDSISNLGSFYNMEYDQFSNKLIGLSPNGTTIVCKTIDLVTKSQTIKSMLISVDSIVIGESTFDPINRRYFSMTNLGVIVIDSTGTLRDVLCSSPGLFGMEYNPISNKIFYLEWNGTNYDFVSVEANTCSISNLGNLNGLISAVRGESTFDKSLGLYYHKTNLGIVQIDSQTGQIQQVISPSNNFGGLEIKRNYTGTGLVSQKKENEISVFPNPSNRLFNFRNLKSGTRLEIYDINGKLFSQTVLSESSIELDMLGETPGIYFYEIRHPEGFIQKGKLILK
jgi:hypothetical protein